MSNNTKNKKKVINKKKEPEEKLEYVDTYYLPELFGIDKNNKERVWKVWVEGNLMTRTAGLIDGKKTQATRYFEGKNIGKKNETTPEQQAKLEAEKLWIKQVDKGYLPKSEEGIEMLRKINEERSKTGGTNVNITAVMGDRQKKKIKEFDNNLVEHVDKQIIPMKAQEWTLANVKDPTSVLPRVLKYFDFKKGVFIQPKFDGNRSIARIQNNIEVVMTSNKGKQFPHFTKLRKEILEFLEDKDYLDGLDGELYSHRIIDNESKSLNDDERFSMIQSICSITQEVLLMNMKINYHIMFSI